MTLFSKKAVKTLQLIFLLNFFHKTPRRTIFEILNTLRVKQMNSSQFNLAKYQSTQLKHRKVVRQLH